MFPGVTSPSSQVICIPSVTSLSKWVSFTGSGVPRVVSTREGEFKEKLAVILPASYVPEIALVSSPVTLLTKKGTPHSSISKIPSLSSSKSHVLCMPSASGSFLVSIPVILHCAFITNE